MNQRLPAALLSGSRAIIILGTMPRSKGNLGILTLTLKTAGTSCIIYRLPERQDRISITHVVMPRYPPGKDSAQRGAGTLERDALLSWPGIGSGADSPRTGVKDARSTSQNPQVYSLFPRGNFRIATAPETPASQKRARLQSARRSRGRWLPAGKAPG